MLILANMIKGLATVFLACFYGNGLLHAQNTTGGLPAGFIGTFEGPVLVYPGRKNLSNKYIKQISIYPSPKNKGAQHNHAYSMTFVSSSGYDKHYDTLILTVNDSAAGTAFITGYDSLVIPARITGNYLSFMKGPPPAQFSYILAFEDTAVLFTMISNTLWSVSTTPESIQNGTFRRQKDPAASAGKLIQLGYFPSQYTAPHRVAVWLPDGYKPGTSLPLPVIYMHDGQMLFDSRVTWNRKEWGMDELIAARNLKAIVVGIWNDGKNRSGDYFPQKVWDNYISQVDKDSIINKIGGGVPLFGSEGTANADAYLKFLVSELKPYIDTYFSPATDKANTIIAGASMGGLISWYALCEYPEVFGGAICLSTHWPGTSHLRYPAAPAAFQRYLAQKLPSPLDHRLFFAHGTGYLDSLYGPHQQKVDALMKKRGYVFGKNWKTNVYTGADHNEKEWRKQMKEALEFVMTEK
jgi:enterochelin esterase-like enzyme